MTNPQPVADALPAAPAAGTWGGQLVTPAEYAAITLDTTSSGEAVTGAVAQSTDMVARECSRTLEYGQYTETLYVYKNGMTYPSATPIAQVDSPPGTTLQAAGVWVGFFLPLPEMPVWSGVVPPQTVVTYWGGYTSATCPWLLKRLLARVAWYVLHPATLSGLPAGVKSVSEAGVSISGDLSVMMVSDPQLRRDTQRYKKRLARAWQA